MVTIMSAEPNDSDLIDDDEPIDDEQLEDDERSPYSSTLAHLGKTMRTYGNTLLVLLIVMLFISIFLFLIVFNPVRAALMVIYIIKAFEFGFYIDFLVGLKRSDSTYGGHFIQKAFILLLSMLILNILILGVGTVIVSLNTDPLLIHFSDDGPAEKVFFYYTMLSYQATWLRYIEIVSPALTIAGSLLLLKWGNLYVGDRFVDELSAPFPKEMKLMILGGTFFMMGIIFGIIVGYIPESVLFTSSILSILKFITSFLQIVGSIITAVGFSRAGYYLELYTTKDKKKFFSSKIYEE